MPRSPHPQLLLVALCSACGASTLTAVLGCGGAPGPAPHDAGEQPGVDGGHRDAGADDAGTRDAGGSDDGGAVVDRDAGLSDAGLTDSGRGDAGTVPDAGPSCAVSSVPTATASARGGNGIVLARGSYDYAPSVMHDGRYRMWWCGGVAGDHILYADAPSLDGPWSTPVSVLTPTGVPGTFDRTHTCDPSVIRVDGVYYLYYGGLDEGEAAATQTTRLGVATGNDGIHWTRMNGGAPIVVPKRAITGLPNNYGAGQPSVTYVDGKFYLMFTDTTGLGGNQINGAGQYVWRSADPAFKTGVEELTATGFAPLTAALHTSRSLTEAFSADWQYVDALDAFMVAVASSTGNGNDATELRFFDRDFNRLPGAPLIRGDWDEGPGLVGRPDRHAIPSSDCGRLPVDVMHALGPGGPATWDLAHSGADVLTGRSCACVDFPRLYEGSLLVAANKPLTLVRSGKRLQFALAAPAQRLARTSYAVPDPVFFAVPYGAALTAGAPALAAPGRPGAFLLDDDKVWPFDCLELVTDNQSSLQTATAAQFDSHPVGPALRCLH
ncbi:MAG: beta-xylosidase [Archangiaceae bacterium]|nr:beta-xylosidase [Archangiaceae bacterium]